MLISRKETSSKILSPPAPQWLATRMRSGHAATGPTRRVGSRAKIQDPWGLCSAPGPRAVLGPIHTQVGLYGLVGRSPVSLDKAGATQKVVAT